MFLNIPVSYDNYDVEFQRLCNTLRFPLSNFACFTFPLKLLFIQTFGVTCSLHISQSNFRILFLFQPVPILIGLVLANALMVLHIGVQAMLKQLNVRPFHIAKTMCGRRRV